MLKGGTKGVTPLVIEVVRIFWAGEKSKGRASPWVKLPGCVKVFWLKKGVDTMKEFERWVAERNWEPHEGGSNQPIRLLESLLLRGLPIPLPHPTQNPSRYRRPFL